MSDQAESGFNERSRIDAFICHPMRSEDAVVSIVRELERYGIRCFLSGADIQKGDDWKASIRHAIARSSALLVFYDGPEITRWQCIEYGIAMGQNPDKLIIPVQLHGEYATPPEPIDGCQKVDVSRDRRAGVHELVRKLKGEEYLVRAVNHQGTIQASAIVARAQATEDPLLAALLLCEVLALPKPPNGHQFALDLLKHPTPHRVMRHEQHVRDVALSAGAELVATACDTSLLLWPGDGGAPRALTDGKGAAFVVALTPDVSHVLGWLTYDEDVPPRVRIFATEDGAHVTDVATWWQGQIWMKLSPSGELLLFERDGAPALWRWRSGGEPIVGRPHAGAFGFADFDAAEQRLVLAGQGGRVVVLDCSTLEQLFAIEVDSEMTFAAISPTGEWIATARVHGTETRLWSVGNTTEPIVMQGVRPTFSPAVTEGYAVATVDEGRVRIYRSSRKRPLVLSVPNARALHWSADGQELVIDTGDGVCVHGIWQGRAIRRLRGGRHASSSPDGRWLATYGRDEFVRLWEVRTSPWPQRRELGNRMPWSCAIRPDQRVAVLTGDYGLHKDFATCQWLEEDWCQTELDLPDSVSILTCTWFDDGRSILVACSDHALRVFEHGFEKPRVQRKLAVKPPPSIEWDLDQNHLVASTTPDGSRIAAATPWGQVFVWTGEPNDTSPIEHDLGESLPGAIVSLAVCSTREIIVLGLDNGCIAVVATATGKTTQLSPRHRGAILAVAFSRSGGRLIAGSKDGTASIWTTGDWRECQLLRGHTGEVTSVSLSEDEDLAVTGSEDGTARVWSSEGGGSLLTLSEHDGGIRSVAFSPNEQYVVTVSADGTIRRWLIDWAASLHELRARTNEVLSVQQRMDHLDEDEPTAQRIHQEQTREHARLPGP